jgi:hypothetical protein
MNNQINHIVRLLQLTKDNKSPVIHDLRRSIFNYINSSELEISQLEMDNMQLSLEISAFENFLKHQEKEINKKLELARCSLKNRT